MNIIKITPRGYCKGVVNAINIAKNTAINNPGAKIYVLGMIVHNYYVTKALEQYNIITIETKGKTRDQLLDEIDEGIVIFTAHGISDLAYNKAIAKGLKVIDASCIDVQSTKNKVKEMINKGYKVIYIGSKNHPEAEAITQDSNDIYLVTSANDVDNLNIKDSKIYVTNQTTMSIVEIYSIFNKIKEKFPLCIIEEEICNATRLRQEAIIKSHNIDLLYVVGDPSSNNSNKLKDIAILNNIKKVCLIENAQQIKEEDLNVKNIGVTAGASTPTYLTNQVIEVLENYSKTNILSIPDIDISKIL